MAVDKKISDLPALTTADATDVVAMVDVSAAVTKKVPVSGMAAAIASSLPTASVDGSKVDFTSSNQDARSLVVGGPTLTVATAGKYKISASLFGYSGTAADTTFAIKVGSTSVISRAVFGQYAKSCTLVTTETLAAGDVITVLGTAANSAPGYSTLSIERVG